MAGRGRTKRRATHNNSSNGNGNGNGNTINPPKFPKPPKTTKPPKPTKTTANQAKKKPKTLNQEEEKHIRRLNADICNAQTKEHLEKLNKFIPAADFEKAKEDIFNCIIINNSYVDFTTKNTQRDSGSFYSLITRDLSQSDAIKLGIAIERIFIDLILTNTHMQNIRKPTTKGKKETDHLFLNNTTNTIYYAEVKGNLNLDTEKRPATILG
jgi:hypothetical protein